MFKRGEFVLRFFENRIRQPRIDEQNFSGRRYDLEGRLTVPSELRIHENHQIEKTSSGKRCEIKNDGARMTNEMSKSE